MEHNQCLEMVKNCQSFKKLTYIQQSMIKKYGNIKDIQHSLIVIKNIGFDQWEKQFKTTYLNILIIKELSDER